MTLDRTWLNTLVDDDGSGTTGSVWDKTGVTQVFNEVDKLAYYCELARVSGHDTAPLTQNKIYWDYDVVDASNMHTPPGTIIAAPSAGAYLISAIVTWPPGTGARAIAVHVNGVIVGTEYWEPAINLAVAGVGPAGLTATLTRLVTLAAGGYAEIAVNHDVAGTTIVLAPYSRVLMHRVS